MDISALSNLSTPFFAEQSARMDAEKLTAETFESVLSAASKSGNDEEIMAACKEFESYFLNTMFKQMRNTIGTEDTSNSQRIFQDMLDEEYAKKSTDQGGIGLATFMFKQMKRQSASGVLE